MRAVRLGIDIIVHRLPIAALGIALMAGAAAAAPLSGGASGGGAIQGGSGAPGSGVGIAGSIVNNTTAEGIGEDDRPSIPSFNQRATDIGLGTPDARAYYPLETPRAPVVLRHHWKHNHVPRS